jgi:acyl-CoA thioesterase-1
MNQILISLILIGINISYICAKDDSKGSPQKILFIGDSLTAGYGLELEQAFPALIEQVLIKKGKQIKVINAGESGASSASAYPRLKWFIKQEPSLIILALGSNDGLRGQAIEQIKENLTKAIKLAQEKKIKLVLVGMQMPPNYGKDYTNQFRSLYGELAKQFNIPLVNFLLEGVAGKSDLNLPDGIHPNAAGHKIMAQTVLNVIEEHL